MASCLETQENLLLKLDDGCIGEEFLLLWEMNNSNNLYFPVHDYPKFDLESKVDIECKAEFRFEKNDLATLAQASQIPGCFKCKQGTVGDSMTWLCID